MGSSPSPMKAKASNEVWNKANEASKEQNSGTSLNDLVAKRKTLEKGSNDYNTNQNAINKAMGNSKRHDTTTSSDNKIGGGSNHRMGLFDAIMIKDNHIDYSNNLEDALYKTQIYIEKLKPKKIFVVVEIRKVFEINKILKFNWIDRILLDNMNVNELKKAVRLIAGKFKIEASGGINELNIIEVAKTGVDYISLGALTHSSPYIDLSLKAN